MRENDKNVEICFDQERKRSKLCHVTRIAAGCWTKGTDLLWMKTKPRCADGLEPIELASRYRPPAASHPAPADGDMRQLSWKDMELLPPLNVSQTGTVLNRRLSAGLYTTGSRRKVSLLLRAPSSDYLSWQVPKAQIAITNNSLHSKKNESTFYPVFSDIRKSNGFVCPSV